MLLSSLFPAAKSHSAGVRRPRPTGRLPLQDGSVPPAAPVSGDAVLEGSQAAPHAVVAVSMTEPHGDAGAVNDSTADGTANSGSDTGVISGTRHPY